MSKILFLMLLYWNSFCFILNWSAAVISLSADKLQSLAYQLTSVPALASAGPHDIFLIGSWLPCYWEKTHPFYSQLFPDFLYLNVDIPLKNRRQLSTMAWPKKSPPRLDAVGALRCAPSCWLAWFISVNFHWEAWSHERDRECASFVLCSPGLS